MDKKKPFDTGCLVCGNVSERLRRGLCQKHYARFKKKLESLGEEGAKAFEQQCLEQGWVAEDKQGKKQKDFDPFDSIADDVKQRLGPSGMSKSKPAKKLEQTEPTIKRKRGTG